MRSRTDLRVDGASTSAWALYAWHGVRRLPGTRVPWIMGKTRTTGMSASGGPLGRSATDYNFFRDLEDNRVEGDYSFLLNEYKDFLRISLFSRAMKSDEKARIFVQRQSNTRKADDVANVDKR